MKKILLLILLVFTLNLFSESQPQADYTNLTLYEFSLKTGIPTQKIKSYLELKSNISTDLTFQQIGISNTKIHKIIPRYKKDKGSFLLIVVIIGMLIVFLSLILVGIIINQLKVIQFLEKLKNKPKKKVKTDIGTITTTKRNLSNNDIVAVITAIYLHELEVEEKNKLLLTWKRANISMWKAANKIEMPNYNYKNQKR